MSTVVDELITKFTLDPRGYQSGANAVKQSSKQAAGSISDLKSAAGNVSDAFGKVGDVIGKVIGPLEQFGKVALGLAGAGAIGLVGLAKYAVDAAMEMDTLQRKLAGVTKSAERTAAIMAKVKEIAGPSIFSFAELAQAATRLEAFGMDSMKWLGLASNASTAMAPLGQEAEYLNEIVSLLGRAQGGNLGDVFGPEGLGRFGIGKNYLKSIGAMFGKDGSFVGDVNTALAIIEKAFHEKFDAIAQSMESGPMAKLASLMDSIRMAAAGAGSVILGYLLPMVQTLSDWFTWLNNSGILVELTKQLADVFNVDAGSSLLIKGLSLVLGLVDSVIHKLVQFKGTVAINFEAIKQIVATSIAVIVVAFTVQLVAAVATAVTSLAMLATAWGVVATMETLALSIIGIGLITLVAGLAAVAIVAGIVKKQMDDMKNGIKGLSGGIIDPEDIAKKAKGYEDIFKAYLASPNPVAPGAGVPSGVPAVGGALGGVNANLSKIAGNTSQIEANQRAQMDMSRHALGGGDIGRRGLSAVELDRVSREPIKVKVEGAGSFDDLIADLINQVILKAKRRGAL